MEKEVLLSVRNLQQYFKLGKHELKAVDNVSFDIYKGEVFGLVGESGCGKTTTGRSIIRLYDITGGSVYYKGERICAGTRSYKDAIRQARRDFKEGKITKEERDEIVAANRAEIKSAIADHNKWSRTKNRKSKLSEDVRPYKDAIRQAHADLKEGKLTKEECDETVAKKREEIKAVVASRREAAKNKKGEHRLTNEIQMIFQDPIASLDPRMIVRDIIAEGLIIRGIKDKEYINEQVYNILETVGLVQEHATRYPHEFSGGQRQRIGIARAVVMKPELIIADEPISALDVSIQAQVINLLNDLSEKMGLTIMFIAHDLAVVKYFSNRIAVMYFGKIVELGTSDELFAHPFHPYTRSLLSAIPLPDPITEKNRKRIVYNPMLDHDYSKEGPSWQEVYPGHFVLCNSEEYERYRKEYEQTKAE